MGLEPTTATLATSAVFPVFQASLNAPKFGALFKGTQTESIEWKTDNAFVQTVVSQVEKRVVHHASRRQEKVARRQRRTERKGSDYIACQAFFGQTEFAWLL